MTVLAPRHHRGTRATRATRAVLAAVSLVAGLALTPPSSSQAVGAVTSVTSVTSVASVTSVTAGVPTVAATSVHRAVPTRDGSLDAVVMAPTTPPPAGRYPLVVIPATFAGQLVDLAPLGLVLAKRGYITVYYLERGYGASTGQIDAAGPKDVADVSQVITWMLANTPADPARVGLIGFSYSAGLVLEAAAVDPRVRAVAELDGWADLGRALYPNRTPSTVTEQALYALATVTGRPSPEVAKNVQDAINDVNIDSLLAFAAERSPVTFASRLTTRQVPLFMSHEMNETIFPIDQSVDFFTAYSGGPKRLDLWPGDHGSQEVQGALGKGGPGWEDAMRWMDAYVAGYDRSITTEPVVRVQPRSAEAPRPLESWASVAPTRTQRVYLATTPQLFGTARTLQATPGRGSQTVREGVNWLIHTLAPMYSYQLEVGTGHPPTVPLPLVDQSVSAIWQTARLTAPMSLRGVQRVHLSVTPSASTGTVVVHTLDVDALGLTGYMVAHQPITFTGTPGVSQNLDVALPYNAYDLPTGHRLAVVVTTSDPSYLGANPPGSTIAIGPSSWMDLPLR